MSQSRTFRPIKLMPQPEKPSPKPTTSPVPYTTKHHSTENQILGGGKKRRSTKPIAKHNGAPNPDLRLWESRTKHIAKHHDTPNSDPWHTKPQRTICLCFYWSRWWFSRWLSFGSHWVEVYNGERRRRRSKTKSGGFKTSFLNCIFYFYLLKVLNCQNLQVNGIRSKLDEKD